MSTSHNRGPPPAWQGPCEPIDKSAQNTEHPINQCHPSAQRKCHLSARPLRCERELAWMPATRDRNDLVFFAFIGAERVAVREAYVFCDREAPAERLLRRAPATFRRPPAMRGGWSEPRVNEAMHFDRSHCMADVLSAAREPRPTAIERRPPWQRVCGIETACIDERAR